MFEFIKSVSIDGKPYKAGDVVDGAEIPDGNKESLLRLKWLKPHEAKKAEKNVEPPKVESDADVPLEPVKPKGGKKKR